MTIILLPGRMQIKTKNNKMLTEIVGMIDGTPLQWYVFSDNSMTVSGNRELLYDLLMKFTEKFFCTIEIV